MADQGKQRQQHETTETRLNQLEQTSLESARLTQELSEQIQLLIRMQEQTARKYRIAIALGAAAIAVAIGAVILAVW
jgi:hypothetical protein